MSLLCTVIGHTPSAIRQHNQGHDFSLCHHCGRDLIRAGFEIEWKPVPKGYKVVFRPAMATADASPLTRDALTPATPRRRDPRGARPAPRRDPRGRAVAGAGTTVSLLANLGELLSAECKDDVMPAVKQRAIRLPGTTR